MSLKRRLRALEAARKARAKRQPRPTWRMTIAALDAELARIGDSLERAAAEDAELRSRIGETAFSAVLVERERAADVFEWDILQGRFPKRDDLLPENERRVHGMLSDLAKAWQTGHEIAGTWPEVFERMTRLEAERDLSKDQ